jgi:hypothetical protein
LPKSAAGPSVGSKHCWDARASPGLPEGIPPKVHKCPFAKLGVRYGCFDFAVPAIPAFGQTLYVCEFGGEALPRNFRVPNFNAAFNYVPL